MIEANIVKTIFSIHTWFSRHEFDGLGTRDSGGSARHVGDGDVERLVERIEAVVHDHDVLALAHELVVLAVERMVVTFSPSATRSRTFLLITLPGLVLLTDAVKESIKIHWCFRL